jgi:hypothetical protein
MIFNTLHDSSQRGELLLVDGGMCHWHLRRDGQLTIREIISTRKGAGSQMLNRLTYTSGATSLFAKCPVELTANRWYDRRGFHVERMEITPSGNKLLHWRKNVGTFHRRPNAGNLEIIYCADGNAQFMEMALDAGMLPGSQLPGTIYYRPYMVDQDWKSPNRERYMAALETYHPHIATVLDWERDDQLTEVLSWAEEASQYVETVVIIPKVWGGIAKLPREINGKPVRLGYSVPTLYGGTNTPLIEFQGWPVHLLGGSPEKQLELARQLHVVSVDTNYMQKMATQYCQYWTSGTIKSRNRHWPTLRESDGGWSTDAPAEAFRRSCHNMMQAWERFRATEARQEAYQMVLV